MRLGRIPRIAAGVAGAAIGLIVVTASFIVIPPSDRVQISQVEWSEASYSNQTGPPNGCLANLPSTSPGTATGTSRWVVVQSTLKVLPAYVGSCYVFGIQVAPAGFQYVQMPGAWFAVSDGMILSLNISTPSEPYGPAPIHVELSTSITPGCLACP